MGPQVHNSGSAMLLIMALLIPSHGFNAAQKNNSGIHRNRRMPPLFYTDIEPEIRSITVPPLIYVDGKPMITQDDEVDVLNSSVSTREKKDKPNRSTKKTKRSTTKSSARKEKKSHETVWHQHYADLLQYKEEHGNCIVPQNYSDKKLGLWVMQQRRQYTLLQQGKNSSLSGKRGEYRLRLLEEIGFVWRLDRRGPRGSYGALRRMQKLTGHEIHTVKNFEQYMIEKGANFSEDQKRAAWLKRFEVLQ